MKYLISLGVFLCSFTCLVSCDRSSSYPPPSGDFSRDIKNVERYLKRKGLRKDLTGVYVEYGRFGYTTHIGTSDPHLENLEWIDEKMNLGSLTVCNAKVSDLTPLCSHTNLEALVINRTLVDDISVVTNFTLLQVLECQDTRVSSLKPLEQLTNLKELNIRGIPCKDMDGIPFSSLEKIQLTCHEGNPWIHSDEFKKNFRGRILLEIIHPTGVGYKPLNTTNENDRIQLDRYLR